MTTVAARSDVAPVDAAELVVILGTLAVGLLLIGGVMAYDSSRFLLTQWAVLVLVAGVVSGVGAAILWGIGHTGRGTSV